MFPYLLCILYTQSCQINTIFMENSNLWNSLTTTRKKKKKSKMKTKEKKSDGIADFIFQIFYILFLLWGLKDTRTLRFCYQSNISTKYTCLDLDPINQILLTKYHLSDLRKKYIKQSFFISISISLYQ